MGNGVLGYGTYEQRGPLGYWVQGYEAQAIGAQGYRVQGVWATWAMGYMGNGAHGRFAPRISKRCQVVKKMSCCQKNVKCQKFKHLDYGGGSQKN